MCVPPCSPGTRWCIPCYLGLLLIRSPPLEGIVAGPTGSARAHRGGQRCRGRLGPISNWPVSKPNRRGKRTQCVVRDALHARLRAFRAATLVITEGLAHGLVGGLQHSCDGAGRHSETPQFSRFFSNLLVDKGRSSIEEREGNRHLGNGSNWLRLRPPTLPSRATLRGASMQLEDLEGG